MTEQRIVYGMEISLRLRSALVSTSGAVSNTPSTLGSQTAIGLGRAATTAGGANGTPAATAFLYSPGPADPRLLVKRWDNVNRPQSNFDLCVFRIEPAATTIDAPRGSAVTFGATIHLIHNFSGRYLSVVRQPADPSLHPSNHFQLQLLDRAEAGRACRLRLTSRYKRRAEGDAVVNKDVCYLQYETGALGLNANVLCNALEDAEATAAEELTPFDVCVYDNTDPNDETRQTVLRAGIAALIFHREKDSLLITEGKSMTLTQELERNTAMAGGSRSSAITAGFGFSAAGRRGAALAAPAIAGADGSGNGALNSSNSAGAAIDPTAAAAAAMEGLRRTGSRKARLISDNGTTVLMPDTPFFRRFEEPVSNLDPESIEFDCSALWFVDLIDPTVGGPIRTARQCRLRHGATNKYLCAVPPLGTAAKGTGHSLSHSPNRSAAYGLGVGGGRGQSCAATDADATPLMGPAATSGSISGCGAAEAPAYSLMLTSLDLSVYIENTIFELELVSSDDSQNPNALRGKPIFSARSYLRVKHSKTGMYLATGPLGTHSMTVTLSAEPTMEDTLAIVVVPRVRQANLTFLMGNASFLNAYIRIFRQMQRPSYHYRFESSEVAKVIERTKASLESLIKFCTQSDCEDALKREGIPIPSHQNSMFEVQMHKLALDVCVAPFVSVESLRPFEFPMTGGVIPFNMITDPKYKSVHEICCLVFRLLKQMSKQSIYAAQLLDYFGFMQQLEGVKFRIADTLMEIVENNRAMLRSEDRCRHDIDHNIKLLIDKERSSGYVKYLSLMCVCTERGIVNNQRYICRKLFEPSVSASGHNEILLPIYIGKTEKRPRSDAATSAAMHALWASVKPKNWEMWGDTYDPTVCISIPPPKPKKGSAGAPAAPSPTTAEWRYVTIDDFLREESGSEKKADAADGDRKKASDARKKMVKFFASSIELMANLTVGLDPECIKKITERYLAIDTIIVALDPSIPYSDAIRASFFNVAHNIIVRRALNDIGRDSHQQRTCGDLVIVEPKSMAEYSAGGGGGGRGDDNEYGNSEGHAIHQQHYQHNQQLLSSSSSGVAAPAPIRPEYLQAVKKLSLDELSNKARHELLRGNPKYIEDYNKLLLSLTSIWHSIVTHEAYSEAELTTAVDSVIRVLVIMLEGKKKSGGKGGKGGKGGSKEAAGSAAARSGAPASGSGGDSSGDKKKSAADGQSGGGGGLTVSASGANFGTAGDGTGGAAASGASGAAEAGGNNNSGGGGRRSGNGGGGDNNFTTVKTTEENIEMIKTKVTLIQFLIAVLKHELSRIADTVMHLWAKEGLSALSSATPALLSRPNSAEDLESCSGTPTSTPPPQPAESAPSRGGKHHHQQQRPISAVEKAAAFHRAQEEIRSLREDRLQEGKLFQVIYGLTCHEDHHLVNAALELGTLLSNSGAYIAERIRNAEPIDSPMALQLFPDIAAVTTTIKRHVSPSGIVVNEEPVKVAIASILRNAEARLQQGGGAALGHPAGIIYRKRSQRIAGAALTRGERPLIARAWGGQLPFELVEYSRLLGRSGLPEILMASIEEATAQSHSYVDLLMDLFNFFLISDEIATRLGPYVSIFCSLLDHERTKNDAVMIVLAVLRCNKASARGLSRDHIKTLVAKMQSDQSGAISQGLEYITLGKYPIPQNQRQVLSSILSSEMARNAKAAGKGVSHHQYPTSSLAAMGATSASTLGLNPTAPNNNNNNNSEQNPIISQHQYVLHRSVINLIACCCVNNSTCRAMVAKEFSAEEIIDIISAEAMPAKHIYPFYKLLASGFLVCEHEWTSRAIQQQKEQWSRGRWWDLMARMLKKLPPFFDYKGGQDFCYSEAPPESAGRAYEVFSFGRTATGMGGGGVTAMNATAQPSGTGSPTADLAAQPSISGAFSVATAASSTESPDAFCAPLIFEGVIPCLTAFYSNLYSPDIHRQSSARIDAAHVAAKAVEVAEWIVRLFTESMEAANAAGSNGGSGGGDGGEGEAVAASAANRGGPLGMTFVDQSSIANFDISAPTISTASGNSAATVRIPKGYIGAAQNLLQAVLPHIQGTTTGVGGASSSGGVSAGPPSPTSAAANSAGGGRKGTGATAAAAAGMDMEFAQKIPSLIEKLGKIMYGRGDVDGGESSASSSGGGGGKKKESPIAGGGGGGEEEHHRRTRHFFAPTDKYKLRREALGENKARADVTRLFTERWSFNSKESLDPIIDLLNGGNALHQMGHAAAIRYRQYHQKIIGHVLSWDLSTEVTISVLASFRVALERSGDDDHLEEAQNYLNEIKMLRVITEISFFHRPDVTHEACCLAIGILENGNLTVQDSLLNYFLSHDERFFHDVDRMLKIAIEDSEQHRTRVANASYYRGHDSPLRFVNVKVTFRFLQLMCEGHHRGLQEYLYAQRDNLRSCNISKSVAHFASELTTHMLDTENMRLLLQTIALLIEICQGPSVNNQTTLVTAGIFEVLKTILTAPQFHLDIAALQQSADEEDAKKQSSGGDKKKKEGKGSGGDGGKNNGSSDADGGGGGGGGAGGDDDDDEDEEETEDDVRLLLEVKSAAVKLILALFEGGTDGSIPLSMINQLPISALSNLAQPLIATRMFTNGDDEEVCDLVYDIMIIMHMLTNSVETKKARQSSTQQQKVIRALRHAHRLLDENKDRIGLLGRIEIERNDQIERVYFRVPAACSLITDETKNQLFWAIDRSTQGSKLSDFLDKADEVIYDVQWLSDKMANNWYIKHLARFPLRFWDDCSLGCAYIINILFVFVMVDAGGLLDTQTDWFGIEGFIRLFAYTQLFITSVAFILDGVLNFPLILYKKKKELVDAEKKNRKLMRASAATVLRSSNSSSSAVVGSEAGVDLSVWQKFIACASRNATIYRAASFFFSALGFWYSDFFFAFHLLGTIKKSSVLGNVVVAVTQNGRSLLLTGLLGCMFVYLFTIVAFVGFKDHFEDDSCESLAGCIVHVLTTGLRQGGGIGDQMTKITNKDPNYLSRVIFDFLFWAFMIVIFLNILFGIIIDTFAELRDEKSTKEIDMRARCFVCGIDSYTFDRYGDGFDAHESDEHNIWQYLYFIHHLKRKAPTEYNGQESYVAACIKNRDIAFFPNNKCSSLSGVKFTVNGRSASAGEGGGGGGGGEASSAAHHHQHPSAVAAITVAGASADHPTAPLSLPQHLPHHPQPLSAAGLFAQYNAAAALATTLTLGERKEQAHQGGLLAPDETIAVFDDYAAGGGGLADDGFSADDGMGAMAMAGATGRTVESALLLQILQKLDQQQQWRPQNQPHQKGGGFPGLSPSPQRLLGGDQSLSSRTAAMLSPTSAPRMGGVSLDEAEARCAELTRVVEVARHNNGVLQQMVSLTSMHLFVEFRGFVAYVAEAEAALRAEKEALFIDSVRNSLQRSKNYIKTLTTVNTQLQMLFDGVSAKYTALQYERTKLEQLLAATSSSGTSTSAAATTSSSSPNVPNNNSNGGLNAASAGGVARTSSNTATSTKYASPPASSFSPNATGSTPSAGAAGGPSAANYATTYGNAAGDGPAAPAHTAAGGVPSNNGGRVPVSGLNFSNLSPQPSPSSPTPRPYASETAPHSTHLSHLTPHRTTGSHNPNSAAAAVAASLGTPRRTTTDEDRLNYIRNMEQIIAAPWGGGGGGGYPQQQQPSSYTADGNAGDLASIRRSRGISPVLGHRRPQQQQQQQASPYHL